MAKERDQEEEREEVPLSVRGAGLRVKTRAPLSLGTIQEDAGDDATGARAGVGAASDEAVSPPPHEGGSRGSRGSDGSPYIVGRAA